MTNLPKSEGALRPRQPWESVSIIKIEVKLKQSEVHFHTCLRLRRKFCGFPVLVKNLLCSTLFLAKIHTTLLSYLVLNCFSRSISVFIRSTTSVYWPDVFVSLFYTEYSCNKITTTWIQINPKIEMAFSKMLVIRSWCNELQQFVDKNQAI